MPVSLGPPAVGPDRLPRVRAAGGFVVFHPRYRAWLARHGVGSAAAALGLPGEVVCGHPDRHVVRVVLGGRPAYLKREHVVGWRVRLRNLRAGFGWVSRAEREAAALRRLEAAGLPGPQWLAYGAAGGRAFLLVAEVPAAADLRAVLGDSGLSPADRRLLAERVGRAVAELHLAGFGTPDLAAKHVLVGRRSGAVTVVDWQAARPGPVAAGGVVRQFAGLAASVADGLAGPRDRLRVLWAYRRVVRRTAGKAGPRFGDLARAVERAAAALRDRPSARDQRQPPTAGCQRLVWLAGEEAVAVPAAADGWPEPAAGPPFYPAPGEVPAAEEWVALADGRRARLARFCGIDPVGRLAAAVRGKPWRSPAARAARVLFHLARYGVAGPELVGFGQQLTSAVGSRSFVAYLPPDGAPVGDRLRALPEGSRERRKLLARCGAVLRRLHVAGCRPTGDEPPFVAGPDGAVAVASPAAVRLARRVGERQKRADLRFLAESALGPLGRTDRRRVVRGYGGRLPRAVGSTPSPRVGEGWGGGCEIGHQAMPRQLVSAGPPPQPSPTRGEGAREPHEHA